MRARSPFSLLRAACGVDHNHLTLIYLDCMEATGFPPYQQARMSQASGLDTPSHLARQALLSLAQHSPNNQVVTETWYML